MQLIPCQAKYIAHDLTLQHAGGGLQRLSQALFNASVDLNPHQVDAAIFALQSLLSKKGVLLADEVGLGRPIEAGIVLCQHWAERRRQLLVIYPASLRQQWALELGEKFNLPAKKSKSLSANNAASTKKYSRSKTTSSASARPWSPNSPSA